MLVPVADNDGRLFRPHVWAELEIRCMAVSGGYNVQLGIQGVWVDTDRYTYRDTVNAYTIALISIRQLSAWVALVEWVLVILRQEALYVEINGVPEIVRKRGD